MRKDQEAYFTPSVRRDIYAFLLNPKAPGTAPTTPISGTTASADGRVPFAVALVASCCKGGPQTAAPLDPNQMDTFSFIDRPPSAQQQLPQGWVQLDDSLLLAAVGHIGRSAPLPLAVTEAFEHYLSKQCSNWGPDQTAHLSNDFLIAFGRELTPRLDIHHRIRSTRLSEEEVIRLTASTCVDQNVLRLFQDAPSSSSHKLLADGSTALVLQPPQSQTPSPASTSAAHASPLPSLPSVEDKGLGTAARLLFTKC